MSNAKVDNNKKPTTIVVDANGNVANLLVDPTTGRLLIIVYATSDPGATTLNESNVDDNKEPISQVVTDDANKTPTPWHIDNRSGFLFIDLLDESYTVEAGGATGLLIPPTYAEAI